MEKEKNKTVSKIIKTVSWYQNREVSTFDAFSAICRIESLVDDVERVQKIFELDEHNFRPLELFSYYAVAVITCLEWHAKSRLADLIEYDPSSVEQKDIENGFNSKNLEDYIKNRSSIPVLIASVRKCSSFSDYIGIFSRIVKFIDKDISFKDIIAELFSEDDYLFDYMDKLFEDRHELVHEISMHRIGHINISSNWDLDQAVRATNFGMRLIKGIEKWITENAPKDFPNLLDTDWVPVSLREISKKEISEAVLSVSSCDPDFTSSDVGKSFAEFVFKHREMIELYEEFSHLFSIQMPESRYIDVLSNYDEIIYGSSVKLFRLFKKYFEGGVEY
jgi:hypothetical protein